MLGDFEDSSCSQILGNPDEEKIHQEIGEFRHFNVNLPNAVVDHGDEDEDEDEDEDDQGINEPNLSDLRCKIFNQEWFKSLNTFEGQSSVQRGLELPIESFKGKKFPIFGHLICIGEHKAGTSIDLDHSMTRSRAAQLNGDILGGSQNCFLFVAKSGLTQLTMTAMKDRVDMQSDEQARLLFSIDVEAALRYFAQLYKHDVEITQSFIKSAEVCRFFRLYYEVLANTSITPLIRLECTCFLLITIRFKHDLASYSSSVGKIAGVPNKTFQGIIVNLWTSLMLNQIVSKPLYPRSLTTSQTCEHLFSTTQRLSPSPTGAILSTLIDDIMARAIYIGQTKMKIDKEFSYLPSKRPVYFEQALVESEEEMSDVIVKTFVAQYLIPKPHSTTQVKFKSSFHFPLRKTNVSGYKITNAATVRNYHKEGPLTQYAAMANLSSNDISK